MWAASALWASWAPTTPPLSGWCAGLATWVTWAPAHPSTARTGSTEGLTPLMTNLNELSLKKLSLHRVLSFCSTRPFGGCPNGMVRRRFRVDRREAERRVRAASGLRLVCGSSMVWPHLLHTRASVRRMPWHTHIMAHLRGAPHTAHRVPCTWHTHIMYMAHPYYGTTYTSMALGRGCLRRSRR